MLLQIVCRPDDLHVQPENVEMPNCQVIRGNPYRLENRDTLDLSQDILRYEMSLSVPGVADILFLSMQRLIPVCRNF